MFAAHGMLAQAAVSASSLAYSFEGEAEAVLDAGSTYELSGAAIGSAAAGRFILVLVPFRSGSSETITSASIGGVTATIASLAAYDGSRGATAFWAVVPSGTTADIIATFSGAISHYVGFAVYNITGLISTTPSDESGSISAALTIDIPANGFAFAVGAGAVSDALTLGGVTTVDLAPTGSGQNRTCGTKETGTLLTGHSITSADANALYAISFA